MTKRIRLPGLLAALLALVGQLAAGALLPMVIEAELLAAPAVTVMCDPAAHDPAVPADHHRHAVAIALCPSAIAVAASPALVSSGPAWPLPTVGFIHGLANWRPPGRGPPPPSIRVGEPRAPPTLA